MINIQAVIIIFSFLIFPIDWNCFFYKIFVLLKFWDLIFFQVIRNKFHFYFWFCSSHKEFYKNQFNFVHYLLLRYLIHLMPNPQYFLINYFFEISLLMLFNPQYGKNMKVIINFGLIWLFLISFIKWNLIML